jgi:hypothetical protein
VAFYCAFRPSGSVQAFQPNIESIITPTKATGTVFLSRR